jgi:cyanophycin synthetase
MTSEYLAPTILSSRRLFGPNYYSASPGAVLDVMCESAMSRVAVREWPAQVRRLTEALGWPAVECVIDVREETASLFLTAPVDGLLSATDLSEHAWVAAEAHAARELGEAIAGLTDASADPVTLLRAAYANERRRLPTVVAMRAYAAAHALIFSLDDEGYSIGAGVGVMTASAIPNGAVDGTTDGAVHNATVTAASASWRDAANVPVVLVTGSNGKTTTTRLVAAMARTGGDVVGWSCSDGVWIGEAQVEAGDYTGPGGARRVLCDPAVEFAVLETARGGMLRRGLAVDRVDAAVITNISADHFGEYGIETLQDLASAKATIARALRPGAALALNADDPTLVALADQLSVPVVWFSIGVANDAASVGASDATAAAVARVHGGVRNAGYGAVVDDGRLHVCIAQHWHDMGAVREMPITLNGAATHNIANATSAALLAALAGLSVDAIRSTLATFGASARDNPGRLMVRRLGDVTLVLDYAHNPDGMASLCRTAAAMPARRRLLLLGQAGNRDDRQLRALAASAWQTQHFDRVIIKEMDAMRRGRAPGEIPAILRDGLLVAGAPGEHVVLSPSEVQGVRDALAWAQPGDLLVLGIHVSRALVLSLLDTLELRGWQAGHTLPPDLPPNPSADSPPQRPGGGAATSPSAA